MPFLWDCNRLSASSKAALVRSAGAELALATMDALFEMPGRQGDVDLVRGAEFALGVDAKICEALDVIDRYAEVALGVANAALREQVRYRLVNMRSLAVALGNKSSWPYWAAGGLVVVGLSTFFIVRARRRGRR